MLLAIKLMMDLNENDPYALVLWEQRSSSNISPLPISLTPSDLLLLKGTSCYTPLVERQKLYSYFATSLFGDGTPQSSLFMWAITQVLSRALSSSHPSPTAPGTETGTATGKSMPYSMVPILDFVNHHRHPNSAHEYCAATHEFRLRATSDIHAEEEVTISYGDARSNHSFLTLYGFVDRMNPYVGDVTCSIPAEYSPISEDPASLDHQLNLWKNNWKHRTYTPIDPFPECGPHHTYVTVSFAANMDVLRYLDELQSLLQHFPVSFHGLLHYCRLSVLDAGDVGEACRALGRDMSPASVASLLQSLELERYDPSMFHRPYGGITVGNERRAVALMLRVVNQRVVTLSSPSDPAPTVAHPIPPGFAECCVQIRNAEVAFWMGLRRFAIVYSNLLHGNIRVCVCV